MIFVDSNVPMYVVGAAHPHKADAQRLIEASIVRGERLVTDAEALQEILQRYLALDRRDAVQPALDMMLGIVDEIFPITAADVDRAKAMALARRQLSARSALHAAVMQREGIGQVLSFDPAFDGVTDLLRLG